MTDNIAPEGFPQMGDSQMACVGLMADIEEGICGLPEEAKEKFWFLLTGDLTRFMELLKSPALWDDYCQAGARFAKDLLKAIDREQDK